MKQKLLAILALLSLSVTGAWAIGNQEVINNWENLSDPIDDAEDYTVFYQEVYGSNYFSMVQKIVTGDDNGDDVIVNSKTSGANPQRYGLTAMHGVTIEKKHDEWITSVEIVCSYNRESLFDDDIEVSSGSFIVTRDNNSTTIIVTGINSSKFTFTCKSYSPHFKEFKINYLEAEPYLLNTNGDLINMVNEYASENLVPYHTRMYKKNVATTLCLPFAIAEYTSGQLYKLDDIAFDEQIGEWVATMEEANQASLSTSAHIPYLFLPSQDGEVSFYGESTTVLPTVAAYYTAVENLDANTKVHEDNNWWVMQGTYQRLNWNANEGALYGFASAFHGADEIDFSEQTIEAGDFVKAKEGAYWPEFRAFLKYEPALASRGGVPAIAPQRVIVRLVNANGSMTKLEAVKKEENGNVWYDLQGRSYNSKPTKAGIYVNNGKKQIVK